MAGLLRFALSEESFPHTLICLTVSMARPWTIMSSLDRWSQLLRRHIDRLKISPQEMKDYESQLQRHFQVFIRWSHFAFEFYSGPFGFTRYEINSPHFYPTRNTLSLTKALFSLEIFRSDPVCCLQPVAPEARRTRASCFLSGRPL